jgi:hypothetical protein
MTGIRTQGLLLVRGDIAPAIHITGETSMSQVLQQALPPPVPAVQVPAVQQGLEAV